MSKSNITDWLKQLDLFGKNRGREQFHLENVLNNLKHLLPNQGPIKDFIHHNPLHGFQSLPFHEGLCLGAKLMGAKRYLNIADYERQFKAGKISKNHLDFAIQTLGIEERHHSQIQLQLLSFSHKQQERSSSVREWGMRRFWKDNFQTDISELSAPLIYKTLSSYLDQGISFWPFPSRKEGLWLSLQELNQNSFLPILPFKKNKLDNFLQSSAQDSLTSLLHQLVGNSDFFSRYLLETILTYPGWMGMVCALETNPSSLRKPCTISVLDSLALVLLIEFLVLEEHFGFSTPKPDWSLFVSKHSHTTSDPTDQLAKIWHEAYEWSFYEELIQSVYYRANHPISQLTSPWAQSIFCIDDRECSLRRHLEGLDSGISTFGTAGFFGIDFWFQPHDELFPMQQSPVTIAPKHIIRSVPTEKSSQKAVKNGIFHSLLEGILTDLFLVPFLSISALYQFIRSIFFAKANSATSSSLNQFESRVILEFIEKESFPREGQFKNGFTVQEMTERVCRTLKGIGLTQNFSASVYVVAHGASSSNNPHFAAYDCGACSGKSGAPNARAFAWMANHPPVRQALKMLGIEIPDSTTFYAVLHDTTQDRALFFDEDIDSQSVPLSHDKFKKLFRKALDYNAKERSRRFALIPKETVIPRAAELIADRAHSIFEPRPELNHATNAAAIVGRRHLTQGLFLDRRAFLQSYDPLSDASGNILAGLLGAIIPVCGGINLEYFFSRIDNERYGAGTKLSHNVVGLMGVSNGVNNDLIPGLPLQMIEAHDPLRLIILIEQEPEVVASVLKGNPFLYEWVNHQWVRLTALSPSTLLVSLWTKDGWKLLAMDSNQVPPLINADPMELGKYQENLPLGVIKAKTSLENHL